MNFLRRAAALCGAALLFAWVGAAIASTVTAQARGVAPRIDGFDVVQVGELSPGSELLFTVFGTPGAQAQLRIDGAAQPLPLQEQDAGVYEGRYVVAQDDRIAPDSRVVAQLRLHGEQASAELEEPLVLGATRVRDPVLAQAPVPREAPMPGDAPMPRESPVPIKGPTPREAPWPREATWPRDASPSHAADPVTADMPRPVPPATAPPARCDTCGVVESVRRTTPTSSNSLLGLIAGGLLGALVGDQVGHGEHRATARVLGAVGGAYAGHEIERRVRQRARYEVIVRLRDGARRSFTFDQPPGVQAGDTVLVADGRLSRWP
jgi:outer membrane lipoprotein SlyB